MLDEQQLKELARYGYVKTVAESTMVYYRPDGTPTRPLPADANNMRHYLDKGFTLELPKRDIIPEPEMPPAPIPVVEETTAEVQESKTGRVLKRKKTRRTKK